MSDQPQAICILGRQPALGLAELESLFGAATLQPIGQQAVLLDVDPATIDFNRLGGSIRLAKVLTRLETTDWSKIEQYLRKSIPQHVQYIPAGKFKLGLSAFGLPLSPAKINATGLTLKKIVKKAGGDQIGSIRVVPNNATELNSAQVLHNGLTSPSGWELLFIRDGNATWLAQTVHVQDIEAYAARDQGRPKRDARVGMLPPKLAQIIVNLATADNQPTDRITVMDPFCGTGVLLQEAALMGYRVYGSDIDPRMIEYTNKNLAWLAQLQMGRHTIVTRTAETADATNHQWQPQPDIVACETYLGRPFNAVPDNETLARIVSDCNLIIKKFLTNLHPQLKTDARLCIAVPSWQTTPNQFKQLPLIDHLAELGYNRISFEHVRDDQLRYYREDQIVARQLLVLNKKSLSEQ